MFAALDDLIERRIDEARRQGAFDDLPGSGRPLELDDDRLVPEELRVAYRILKNAGYLPREVEALRDVDALLGRALDVDVADEGRQRALEPGRGPGRRASEDGGRAAGRMIALVIALEQRGAHLTTGAALDYRRAFVAKFTRG